MTAFHIHRPDNVPLEFDGELLADLSSRLFPDQQRWSEIRIYRAASGRFVTEMIGRTTRAGEYDRINVNVYIDPAKVREGFLRPRDGQPGVFYLTSIAEDAITAAAEKYPELTQALTERI